jgi:hypothetical protein
MLFMRINRSNQTRAKYMDHSPRKTDSELCFRSTVEKTRTSTKAYPRLGEDLNISICKGTGIQWALRTYDHLVPL